MAAERVLIIGLDGATFNIVGPYIEQGRLPNLQRLIETGTSGKLRSCLPPVTCPAWPTFATGRGAGKHGLFTFIMYDPRTGKAEFINNRTARCKKLWHYAGEAGLRPAIISVPITYPVDLFDGFMVSGFPALEMNELSVHPADWIDEFKAAMGDWEMSSGMVNPHRTLEEKVAYFTQKMEGEIESRVRALAFAVKKLNPRLAIVVLKNSDNMQHALYGLAAPAKPGAPDDPVLRERVAAIYQKMDEAVGRFIETFGEGADVIIMSDHGFTAQRPNLLVDEYLRRDGLVAQSLPQRVKDVVAGARGKIKQALGAGRMRPDAAPLSARSEKRRRYVEGELIDMSRSKVFTAAPSCMGVWLNLKDRNINGVVEPGAEADRVRDLVTRRLLEARDPSTGEPMIKAVHRKEDVYSGSCLDRIPDLLVEPYSGYGISPGFLRRRNRFPATRPHWPAGDHARDGIMVLSGPTFRRGHALDGDLWDITPTALASLGLPVPDDMDGRVLAEAFAEGAGVEQQVGTVSATGEDIADEASPYSAEAEAEITKRLEDLGYL